MALIFSILCLAILTETIVGASATNYCNLKSCIKENKVHTMCKYTSPTPATLCKQWSHQGFNDVEREAIVKRHNQFRQKVASGEERRGKNGPQPAAVSMPDLIWDKELETIAQRSVNQCITKHDDCRNVERFAVGQNLARVTFSGKNETIMKEIIHMIQLWYNEVVHFNRRYISAFGKDEDGDKVGHYTQIVWAGTTKIGCGRIMFKKPDNSTVHYLVCNYGPSGNIEGGRIYKIKE